MGDHDARIGQNGLAPGNGPVIITVHGTNDAHPADAGDRWWQDGSVFTTHLAERLSEHGISQVTILPVHWSGANSDFDRLAAARRLARVLKQVERAGRPHTVIGHSHGGNVVMEALSLRRSGKGLDGIITFGTPFFTRRLKTVPWLIAAFQICFGVVITPIMLWYLVYALSSDTNKKIEALVLFGGLATAGLLSLRKGIRELTRGRWTKRLLPRVVSPADWLVIHSPRDEAMRLLETAAALSPRYVTTASAIRSLTAFASVAGVVLTVAFFAYTWNYFTTPIVEKLRAGTYGLATAADLTFLLLVPALYGAIFGATWLIARAGGAWLYATALNILIHGGVIGAAFGGDARFKLIGVKRVPPYLPDAQELRLEALNLGGIDDKAVLVSAQELYDDIMTHDGASGPINDPDALWKRLSDALYHNAYMRDDGIISRVADHLARKWSGLSDAGNRPS